jgi:uncharacterized protein YfdQ (DUF2303 family)
MEHQTVHPIDTDQGQSAPHLTIDSYYKADDGSEWLRMGDRYEQIVAPWSVESHIRPFRADENLGDVESFCAFVERFSTTDQPPLLTWGTKGLRAVLDFGTMDAPGRGAVTAFHPFETTRQWRIWERMAAQAHSQKALVEALEEHRLDVRDPDAATLVGLIRALRVNVNVSTESELEPNGNTKLSFLKNTTTSIELPPSITIGIPVLKGHTAPDDNGVEGPVLYELDVLIRVDILEDGDKKRPVFRLTIPNAEQALEDAVADRVAAAKDLLGDKYPLYRATA